jgi:hypothetical protein
MGTFNGIGTMYHTWRHQVDGTAFAIKWFVLFCLPIVPLPRHHLRIVTDFSQKEPFLTAEKKGFFAGLPVQSTNYQQLGVGHVLRQKNT